MSEDQRNCKICSKPFPIKANKSYCDECKYNRQCIVEGCERPVRTKTVNGDTSRSGIYCPGHAKRNTKGTDMSLPIKVSRNPGEGSITSEGYKRITTDTNTLKLEHRYVMEQALERELEPWETVHHLNGDKLDNNLTNLELWISRHPKGQRVEDMIAFAEEIPN